MIFLACMGFYCIAISGMGFFSFQCSLKNISIYCKTNWTSTYQSRPRLFPTPINNNQRYAILSKISVLVTTYNTYKLQCVTFQFLSYRLQFLFSRTSVLVLTIFECFILYEFGTCSYRLHRLFLESLDVVLTNFSPSVTNCSACFYRFQSLFLQTQMLVLRKHV